MDESKYEFSNEANSTEVYKIAKSQFKKIIKNFNQRAFKDNFEELFDGGDSYYKLFLKKNDVILCGMLSFLFKDCAFIDIFFWNQLYQKTNRTEFRYISEKFMIESSKIGINNAILPVDKSRSKYEIYKKYHQRVFFTEDEYKINDQLIKEAYKNYYLLKINYKDYFKKAEKANARILHE